MRKIFNTLVASILLVACLFMVGCAKIPKDYKDARNNLKDAGYDVEVVSDFETYVYGFSGLLYVLLETEDYEYLEENYDYIWEEVYDEYKHNFEKGLFTMDGELYEYVIIAYFDEVKTAKSFYNDMKDLMEDVTNSSYIDGWDGYEEDMVYGRSGKAVYFGTKTALEDVRG